MAITVKHKFVSTIPDDPDATLIRPSNWNDTHDLTGTVPIANGGTNATTAADALTNLGAYPASNPAGYGTGTVTSVAATVPSFLSVTGSPITTSGTLALTYSGTALPVANGGTGVTTSSGANSVVLRDANANITTNCLFEGFSSQAASGTTIVLTASSVQNWQITGSGGQTIRLPDATTLPNGATFTFNNNQSSGAITVQNNSSTTVATINSGGYVIVVLLSNSIAAGSWDRHDSTPSNVSWSTNTLDYAGSITSATWNGTAVAINRGGTGQTTASTAFNALSPLTTAGDTLYGGTSGAGTRLAIGTAGQVLTVNGGATAPTWTTPTTGTVTSVGGTGTVSGISLSGTVTSSGNLTLGGTLDLSSPPAIGGTTPNTGTFSLISSTRINPRVTNTTSSATITPASDTTDQISITALAVGATFAIPSGTPVAGQKLTIRIKDNGTAQTLTWTTSAGGYRVIGCTLPTTTVASKVIYVGCIYNATESFWDVVSVAQQI
jgi:trimeric autotransporter adhesin